MKRPILENQEIAVAGRNTRSILPGHLLVSETIQSALSGFVRGEPVQNISLHHVQVRAHPCDASHLLQHESIGQFGKVPVFGTYFVQGIPLNDIQLIA
jgi:hypothetical protein